jgi:hypothetical protein
MTDFFLFDISVFLKFFLEKYSDLPSSPPTYVSVASHLDVISLSGGHVLQISVDCTAVSDIYDEVDNFLQHKFIFSLVHGETEVSDMQFEEIHKPIVLIKKRGPFPYGLHRILRQIGEMVGSNKVEHILLRLQDSPGKLPATAAQLYRELFHDCRQSGYILQGRVMSLYTLLIREGAIPSEAEVLKEMQAIDRDSAIRRLILMHNDHQIDFKKVWFFHGSREVGLPLR